MNTVRLIGAQLLNAAFVAGDCILLLLHCLRECAFLLAHPRRILEQMKRAGYETWLISSGIGRFIGMILGFHLGLVFSE
jgi:ABC-type transporter Mla maintaining outer membrane lipid asymmetry permease subunit MlaE